ncbi:MAG: ABC transporter ATP-binding protein [Thermoleophilia bacterium]|nr:ABC transporter ATP-binding protein [Thermoleophilia bacterium]
MEYVVETLDLSKHYGEHILAVEKLNLRLHRGEVYGFLGPNGAGKTTTLRMLLGLIRPTHGTARVLSQPPGAPSGLARLGALVETPAFYPYLSGRDNLNVLARHAGIPRERILPALEQVDLADRAGDAFKTYSLGMKQRLEVAAALLKDPELLILDEPTNGLDPAGMAEMRVLIKSLGQGNRTVLLSSHLMNEVEQICDRVGVIHLGELVAEGTVDELRGQGRLRLRVSPLEQARELAAHMNGVTDAEVSDGRLRIAVDAGEAARINRELVLAGVEVSEVYRERDSLETVFLGLTQNGSANDVE